MQTSKGVYNACLSSSVCCPDQRSDAPLLEHLVKARFILLCLLAAVNLQMVAAAVLLCTMFQPLAKPHCLLLSLDIQLLYVEF